MHDRLPGYVVVSGPPGSGKTSLAAPLADALQLPLFAKDTIKVALMDVLEVFCRCDRKVAERRYRERAGSRAASHFDERRRPDELWNDEVAEPVAGGWPVLEVDTSGAVDVSDVAAQVRAAMPAEAAR